MNLEQDCAMRSRAAPDSGALACEEYGLQEAAAITVMVASDRQALHAAWLSMLECDAGIELKGSSGVDASSLAASVALHRPKVLLLDQALLDSLDQQSLRTIHEQGRHVHVLLLGDELSHGLVNDVLRNRFNGFLRTTCLSDVAMKAIRAVSNGELGCREKRWPSPSPTCWACRSREMPAM